MPRAKGYTVGCSLTCRCVPKCGDQPAGSPTPTHQPSAVILNFSLLYPMRKPSSVLSPPCLKSLPYQTTFATFHVSILTCITVVIQLFHRITLLTNSLDSFHPVSKEHQAVLSKTKSDQS